MNIRDIARLANVTPGTVSKVVNNYPEISESTRQHVLKIIEQYQYVPSNSARQLKLAMPIPQVGLVIEGCTNLVYELIGENLGISIHNANYTLLYFHDNYHSQDKSEKFQELTTFAQSHRLDCLVYVGGNFLPVPREQLAAFPCPVIFVNTLLPEHLERYRFSSIQTDHYRSAHRQMRYLLEQGHRRICCLITSYDDISIYSRRLEAYRNALAEAGVEWDPTLVVEGRYNAKLTLEGVQKCLQENPDVTAICCAADVMALAAMRGIHLVGKVPGQDVALISFDGLESLQYATPAITALEQPAEEIARCAFNLLTSIVQQEQKEPVHITYQARLVIRET